MNTESIKKALRVLGSAEGLALSKKGYDKDVRDAVICSIRSALALDAVGLALSHYDPEVADIWCRGDRNDLPTNPDAVLNGKGSVNSLVLVLAFDVVSFLKPTKPEDVADFRSAFVERLAIHLESFRADKQRLKYYAMVEDENSMVPIAMCLALAYYTAITAPDEHAYLGFVDSFLDKYEIDYEVRQAAMFTGHLVHTLLHEGYYCEHTLTRVASYGLVPDSMMGAVQVYHDNATNYDFIGSEYDSGIISEDAPYSCRVLTEALFYMLRMSTHEKPSILTDGKPRDQLKHVMKSKYVKVYDLGFLFGALCTASEHNHSLVLRELREGSSLLDSQTLVTTLVDSL